MPPKLGAMGARRLFSRLDRPLLAIAGAITAFGLVAVYSATRSQPALTGGDPFFFLKRQLLWLLIGLLGLVLIFLLDYEALARLHRPIYCCCLLLLALVLKFGSGPGLAMSWISLGSFRFQPSELAKLGLIVVLATHLGRRADAAARFPTLGWSFLLVIIPTGLVLIQPDFGTAMVFLALWLGIVLAGGVRVSHLFLVLLACTLVFGAAWRLNLLRPHQKQRLTSFLHPRADPLGASYQLLQSRIAVGSGQLLGKGLFRGTQGQLRFIPEHHTDFIFTVVGEEFGFLGAGLLILLYFLLLWRGLQIARRARDRLGALLAVGVVSMLGFHVFINIGMTLGLLPITGIPLPLFSYGGSNLLASLLALGLLLNIFARRHKIIF